MMKEDKANTPQNSESAPNFVLRDGALRSATWRSEGEYGPLFNTRITKLYRDEDGNPRETATLNSKDLLQVSELARETHREVLMRRRAHSQEKQKSETRDEQRDFAEDWHDEESSRQDIARERFKEERKPSRGARRAKPRDRAAR
ncbi:hypothetical protein HY36_16760 [Hyphomonas atlantica]|uniref:Uncharacterized protein n=2 Tax=Hyphomonas atlantica TaxID=1280948 RepID=A0A059E185_9PROT|nr:hypothetical protein HY36_16760 [Hyphomonas atlantica]